MRRQKCRFALLHVLVTCILKPPSFLLCCQTVLSSTTYLTQLFLFIRIRLAECKTCKSRQIKFSFHAVPYSFFKWDINTCTHTNTYIPYSNSEAQPALKRYQSHHSEHTEQRVPCREFCLLRFILMTLSVFGEEKNLKSMTPTKFLKYES